MNKIKEIKLNQTNWLELTIVNEDVDILCESFGDNDEYTELLKQRCAEFGVELTEEHLNILTEQKANKHIPTEDELAEIEAKKQVQIVQELKGAKTQALNTIVVDVDGKLFDGNETARLNIMSVIQSSELFGLTETGWKLADNTAVLVNLAELKMALALSIEEVGRIVMVTKIEDL